VTAALLAVLASISALEAEHAAAEAILAKNDAVLWQSRASDEWAYRQAKSIKLHLQELTPGSAADPEGQRTEIAASEARARTARRTRASVAGPGRSSPRRPPPAGRSRAARGGRRRR